MLVLKKLRDNLWALVLGVGAMLALLFVRERNKRKAAEVGLINAETSQKSAVLKTKQEQIESQIKDTSSNAEAEKAKVANETVQDLAEWVKKRY